MFCQVKQKYLISLLSTKTSQISIAFIGYAERELFEELNRYQSVDFATFQFLVSKVPTPLLE